MEKRITPHTVMVVGATGLVGSKLLDLLVAEIAVTRIIVLGRSAPVLDSNKIDFHGFDFQDYTSIERLFQGVHSVYCCIGTTIKKAGSQENFRKIDFDIPVNLARFCEKSDVTSFLVISSLGANADSSNFYLKTKGEMEKTVAAFKIPKIAFFRPSLLLGPRSETRYFESVMKVFLAILGPFMIGVFKKFKPISNLVVARAMIHVSYSSSNVKVYETDEIRWMGR
jgi:uncharacterized protein YbjT (DUF2867 family)